MSNVTQLTGNVLPWVVEFSDIKLMEDLLLYVDFYRDTVEKKRLHILEWGAGNSTIYYPMFLKSRDIPFHWVAIEHDDKWVSKIWSWIRRYSLGSNVHIDYNVLTQEDLKHHGNSPSVSTSNKDCYIGNAKQLATGNKYDIIYVDGRIRNRCIAASVELLSPDGRIILDNANRRHYHKCLHLFNGQFIKPHLWVGRLK